MTAIAPIIVQLVHIQGPLKGEIQELPDIEISIGRHPECQVRFPKDLVTISRRHARIVREGNRFKLIDQSTNGTYVNGRPVSEAYLKDGDVITFTDNGPKLSFLTRIDDQAAVQPTARPINGPAPTAPASPSATSEPIPAPSQSPAPQDQPTAPPPRSASQTPPLDRQTSAPQALSAVVVESTRVPFAIQYGPALKSFQVLPITLGKGTDCDFSINHPDLNDRQAQIFFYQDSYWIKDLTGSRAVSIDGVPCDNPAPLQPDAQVALSPRGPRFRFLGGGRLAEIEDPQPRDSEPAPQEASAKPPKPAAPDHAVQKGGLFKKFFS